MSREMTVTPDQWHSAVKACLDRKRVLRCASCPYYRKADCAYLLEVAEEYPHRQSNAPTLEERAAAILRDVERWRQIYL